MQRCGRCAGYVGPWWFHFICYNCGHEPRKQQGRVWGGNGPHKAITLTEYVQGITWAELGYSLDELLPLARAATQSEVLTPLVLARELRREGWELATRQFYVFDDDGERHGTSLTYLTHLPIDASKRKTPRERKTAQKQLIDAWVQRNISGGICARCKDKAIPGQRLCQRHKDYARVASGKYDAKRRQTAA